MHTLVCTAEHIQLQISETENAQVFLTENVCKIQQGLW